MPGTTPTRLPLFQKSRAQQDAHPRAHRPVLQTTVALIPRRRPSVAISCLGASLQRSRAMAASQSARVSAGSVERL